MGPGLAIKAVAGRHFSLLAFAVAQVAMDIEPLIGMIRGSAVLHGLTHTYLGATAIALVAAGITPLIGRPILRRWNQELRCYRLGWLSSSETMETRPVLTGAVVGTLSHIALDSFMHADIQPLLPWSKGNDLLGLISISSLHQLCIASGIIGLVAWLWASWRQRKERPSSP